MTEMGEFTHDILVAGDKGLKTEDIFIKSGTAALVRGTVLGRVKQSTPTTGSVSGTGNGTCTSVTGGPKTKRGTYNITCVVAITHGGTFDVTDPDGEFVGQVTITAGAGGTGVFKSDHLNFTLTDGSTDFALADVFTVTVTIQPRQVLKLDKTATDGSSAPYAVASEDVDASAAAKNSVGYLEGDFNQRALVFASGTDIEDVRDEMRDLGMLVKPSVNN